MSQCMEDEKNYYNAGLVSEKIIKRACTDYIKNEKEMCYEECILFRTIVQKKKGAIKGQKGS